MKLLHCALWLLLLVGLVSAAAEDKKGPTKEALVGRWQVTQPKDIDWMSMEFTKDGKCRWKLGKEDEDVIAYTYALDGDRLTLTEDRDEAVIIKRKATIKKLTSDMIELDVEGVSDDGKPKTLSYKLKRVEKK
jgi:uncharacterized protein (TIGR03066 family)